MTKTMAEVLAEHQICLAWENGEERGITCLCGQDLPTEQERGEIDMTFLASHQATALAAAGYGLVADAKREELNSEAVLAILNASGVPMPDQFDALVTVQKLAEAWDEGYNAGDYQRPASNPYREAQYLDAPLYSPSKAQLKAEDS